MAVGGQDEILDGQLVPGNAFQVLRIEQGHDGQMSVKGVAPKLLDDPAMVFQHKTLIHDNNIGRVGIDERDGVIGLGDVVNAFTRGIEDR